MNPVIVGWNNFANNNISRLPKKLFVKFVKKIEDVFTKTKKK